jgi:hypothetical protein
MTTTATTMGGITTVKTSTVAAHIAGDVFSEAAAIHTPGTPRGADGTEKQATPSTPRANDVPATALTDDEYPQHRRILRVDVL